MTLEKQQVAVAEALRWEPPTDCTRDPKHPWRSPVDGCCYDSPPDIDDLNVIHELEKLLSDSHNGPGSWTYYANCLMDICGSHRAAIHATAEQRREAFLRTKGLWKES
jgi:hypothetical protein